MSKIMLCSTVVALLTTAGIVSAVDPAMTKDGVLVDAKGMTLYTYDKDAAVPGKSVCNGQCATNWPPLMAGMEAKPMGAWTVIARDDGSKQWAYKGKPLYTWAKDKAPGDKTGEGMAGGAWHVATP